MCVCVAFLTPPFLAYIYMLIFLSRTLFLCSCRYICMCAVYIRRCDCMRFYRTFHPQIHNHMHYYYCYYDDAFDIVYVNVSLSLSLWFSFSHLDGAFPVCTHTHWETKLSNVCIYIAVAVAGTKPLYNTTAIHMDVYSVYERIYQPPPTTLAFLFGFIGRTDRSNKLLPSTNHLQIRLSRF